MTNILQVIEPFFVLEPGDTMELTEDGKNYVAKRNEEFHKHGDDNEEISSSYSSTFTISKDMASSLIQDGILQNMFLDKAETNPNFVNVFDEINKLLCEYTDDLKNIDEDFANMPECMKVEKTTVLSNLIKVLTHLKGLKK